MHYFTVDYLFAFIIKANIIIIGFIESVGPVEAFNLNFIIDLSSEDYLKNFVPQYFEN